jgi:hypothetical protein
VEAGLHEGEQFSYFEDEGADHHEAHWGRRFRDALPFLLGRKVGRSEGRKDLLPVSDAPTNRLTDTEVPT